MKLDYDIELNILEDIHELDPNQCFIFSDEEGSDNYFATTKIIDDIVGVNCFNKWKDNTHSQFPPDFINKKDSLLMEVMRIDDHSPDGKRNLNAEKLKKVHKFLQGEYMKSVEELVKNN